MPGTSPADRIPSYSVAQQTILAALKRLGGCLGDGTKDLQVGKSVPGQKREIGALLLLLNDNFGFSAPRGQP
jgi:hypothetical protein